MDSDYCAFHRKAQCRQHPRTDPVLCSQHKDTDCPDSNCRYRKLIFVEEGAYSPADLEEMIHDVEADEEDGKYYLNGFYTHDELMDILNDIRMTEKSNQCGEKLEHSYEVHGCFSVSQLRDEADRLERSSAEVSKFVNKFTKKLEELKEKDSSVDSGSALAGAPERPPAAKRNGLMP